MRKILRPVRGAVRSESRGCITRPAARANNRLPRLPPAELEYSHGRLNNSLKEHLRMKVINTLTARRALWTASTALLCAVGFLLPAEHGRSADATPGTDPQIDAKAFRC